ncbi:hypothetical protein QBC36DRAFT_71280 [Triangularia setosa]|uniref:Uncharacterized protein n=1 Tax=Triangularia setosa TaxID=2587417 RepID=A0AAN7A487_9PEZI|nr:hypothetical protein QBC36DRAFT_71280 [Podospora setosa]
MRMKAGLIIIVTIIASCCLSQLEPATPDFDLISQNRPRGGRFCSVACAWRLRGAGIPSQPLFAQLHPVPYLWDVEVDVLRSIRLPLSSTTQVLVQRAICLFPDTGQLPQGTCNSQIKLGALTINRHLAPPSTAPTCSLAWGVVA